MASITFTRDSGYVDRIRRYKVICNSEVLGLIGDGETKTFELEPGDYEVFLKIDWCRSNKVQLTLLEGEKNLF